MSKKTRVRQVTDALLGFRPGMQVLIARYKRKDRGTLLELLPGFSGVWLVRLSDGRTADVISEGELEHDLSE
jgi:hypothetical protein